VFAGVTYGKLFRPFRGSDGSEHQWSRTERSLMSNFIVRQEGPSPRVAEKVWEVRLGTGSLLLGALAGVLAGLYLGRRGGQTDLALKPKDWPVNIAHRGGAEIAPENTLEGFREGLRVGAGVLELDVHTTADGHVVVIHDATVDRTTDSTGAVREMTLAEVKRLDAGYRFTPDGGATFPFRGGGIRIPTLEEVYGEFVDMPINVEIKGERPDIEEALWRIIEAAGAEDRTLVVSESTATIRRFREVSGGRVGTASSSVELISFWLLSHLGLSWSFKPPFQALQGPETYHGLRIVTPGFVRAAHERGLRVDVWTIDHEPDMRRLLGYGVDGIMTDRPDVLARVLEGSGTNSAAHSDIPAPT
jgi:glycerophosphoryl diester phosphodiesterase